MPPSISGNKDVCPPRLTSSTRVIIVDDDPIVLRSLQTLVTCLGYEVTSSQSPAEICNLIEADPGVLDLLMTDLDMPEMQGRELIQRVRAVRPGIPVLVVTGSYSRQRIKACRYLFKPCSSHEIASAIQELVRL